MCFTTNRWRCSLAVLHRTRRENPRSSCDADPVSRIRLQLFTGLVSIPQQSYSSTTSQVVAPPTTSKLLHHLIHQWVYTTGVRYLMLLGSSSSWTSESSPSTADTMARTSRLSAHRQALTSAGEGARDDCRRQQERKRVRTPPKGPARILHSQVPSALLTFTLPVAAGVRETSAAACRWRCDVSEGVLWTAWEDTRTERRGTDTQRFVVSCYVLQQHAVCASHLPQSQ